MVLPYSGYLSDYCPWPVLVGKDGAPRFCYWGYGYKERATRRTWKPSEIVLHATAGTTFEADVWYITKRNPRAISCHFIIGKAGELLMLCPLDYVAWHAGHWGHNLRSVGIELVHANDDSAYPEAQLQALIYLCAQLCELFAIDPWTGIIGHRDIVPTICPRGLDVREIVQGVALEMAI